MDFGRECFWPGDGLHRRGNGGELGPAVHQKPGGNGRYTTAIAPPHSQVWLSSAGAEAVSRPRQPARRERTSNRKSEITPADQDMQEGPMPSQTELRKQI